MSTLVRTDYGMSLAENLRELRMSAGLSQTELAHAIGMSYPRISEIERNVGNPTLHTLARIAEFFGVSVGELVEGKKFEKVS